MTLFAGALLRTIEFVMVTTDASFPGPGELGGSRELGSRADDARQGEGCLRRGTGPPRVGKPRDAVRPQGHGGQACGQATLERGAGVDSAHRSCLGPQSRIGMEVPKLLACLLDCLVLLGVLAASSSLCPRTW